MSEHDNEEMVKLAINKAQQVYDFCFNKIESESKNDVESEKGTAP